MISKKYHIKAIECLKKQLEGARTENRKRKIQERINKNEKALDLTKVEMPKGEGKND